jgi:hypothetical protein
MEYRETRHHSHHARAGGHGIHLRNRAGTLSRDLHGTTSDLLLVYAPGSSPDHWPDGMAKFVPAGSDLVFQIHYTTNGTPGSDQSSIGLVFARKPPAHGSSLCN